MVYYHATLISNLDSILKNGLIPQIGERSEGVENEPGVFLFPSYKDCENALMNWLGAEYDETNPDEEAISLKVELPEDFPLEYTCEWERVSKIPIPPKYISFYKNEG